MSKDGQTILEHINSVLKDYEEEGGIGWGEDVYRLALAALTQPASPALKLPEPEFYFRQRSDGGYEGPLHKSRIEDCRKSSWLPLYTDAPHTAPIEPTGGAGWVRVPRKPTQKMIDAHMEGMAKGGAMKAYLQMLAAAPEEK